MILASNSPRRKEILENFGLTIQVISKEVEEVSSKDNYIEITKDIAYKKGVDIALENPEELVVSADTIVVLDNEIMGKPKDIEEAKKMLSKLSGREHEVLTAFAVFYKEKTFIDYCSTMVKFKDLETKEIEWYINTGEAMDKAGAYGIQGSGNILVESIKGDFFNVMGFPLSKFYDTLKKQEINLLESL